MSAPTDREDLYVPDRFENLRDAGDGALRTVIVPVEAALDELDERFADMRAARRGGLLVMRGDPGAGKSTFLETFGQFRTGGTTHRVPPGSDLVADLNTLSPTASARLVVIEGREALLDVSEAALEKSMHAINTFVRSPQGGNTLIVWPTNTDELANALISLGRRLGGEALLGTGKPIARFAGPPKNQFVGIAERTVGALNEGASLYALGISEDEAADLAGRASNIGHFLTLLRGKLLENGATVKRLLKAEQFRMWTVVIAGTEPEGDVAALTRGGFAYIDIDRLMTATGANIVAELKSQPDTLGILGTVLDAKIIHLNILTALAVARQYADEDLRALMKRAGMSTSERDARARVLSSELGLIFAGDSLGTRRRGKKPGGSTKTAFGSLSEIAKANDGLLNRAIGRALQDAGLIDGFEAEKIVSGSGRKYWSDLYVTRNGEAIRLEFMWRSSAGRADIANYVLGKLGNYAKAIGLLS